jgi:ABC-type nitrate/sulfonate/bicarbonate transport system substrate-binding protein
MRRALLHGIDWPQGGTMRGRNTTVAIIASLFALETAHADPLIIRSGWVVMTSGYTPMVVEAKDQLKHYGSSYVIDPIHFQGSAPSMAALASGGVDIIHDPAHRPEATALAARVTKQPYERLNSYLFSTSDFYSDPKGMPDAGALQSGIDMMVALGFAKESIDVKRYLDLSLVQEAAKRLP